MFNCIVEVYLFEVEGILAIALLQIVGYKIWDKQAESGGEVVRRAYCVIQL